MAGMFAGGGMPFGGPDDPLILYNPKTGWMACKAPMGYMPTSFPPFPSPPNSTPDQDPNNFFQQSPMMMNGFQQNGGQFMPAGYFQTNGMTQTSQGTRATEDLDSDSDIIHVSPSPASASSKEQTRKCSLCADLGIERRFVVGSDRMREHVTLHVHQTGDDPEQVEELCFSTSEPTPTHHRMNTVPPIGNLKSTKKTGRSRDEQRSRPIDTSAGSPGGSRTRPMRPPQPPASTLKRPRLVPRTSAPSTIEIPKVPEETRAKEPSSDADPGEIPSGKIPEDLDRMLLRFTEKCLRKRRKCNLPSCNYSSPLTVKSKLYQSLNFHILSHFGDHLLFCPKCNRKLNFGKGTHHRKFHPEIVAKDFYIDMRAEHEAELIEQFKECFQVNKGSDDPSATEQHTHLATSPEIKNEVIEGDKSPEKSVVPMNNENSKGLREEISPRASRSNSKRSNHTDSLVSDLNFANIFVPPLKKPPIKSSVEDTIPASSTRSKSRIKPKPKKDDQGKFTEEIETSEKTANGSSPEFRNKRKLAAHRPGKENSRCDQPSSTGSPDKAIRVYVPPIPAPQNFLAEMKRIEKEYAMQNLQCMIPNCYLAVRNKSLKVLMPHLIRHFGLMQFNCSKCRTKDKKGVRIHAGPACKYRNILGGFEKDLITLARKCFPVPQYLIK